MTQKLSFKKGQVVLFVVIILTISVIIVSSIFNRSLISQRNVNINTDSTRAFNAAESGLDELLARSDLATVAGSGQTIDASAIDKSVFKNLQYKAEEVNPGYYGLISKDSLVQFNFVSTPTNLRIYFDDTACVLLSFYDIDDVVTRRVICSSNVSSTISGSESVAPVLCPIALFGTLNCVLENIYLPTTRMLLVKILLADSHLSLAASNYPTSFLTKNIVATAWAETKTGVKKEIQVETKTTKDVYPVFDYALYVR